MSTASRQSPIVSAMPAAMMSSWPSRHFLLPPSTGGSIVARLGGEEFGVIVTGEVLEERLERVDSVRAKLAECPVLADGCQVAITVSAGIADLSSGRNSE